MSSVMRLSFGSRKTLEAFLNSTELPIAVVFIKGERRFPNSQTNFKLNSINGVNVEVGKSRELKKQIQQTQRFLVKNMKELRSLQKKGLKSGCIDFSVERRDVYAQFDTVPAKILLLLGQCGLDLELSQYTSSGAE